MRRLVLLALLCTSPVTAQSSDFATGLQAGDMAADTATRVPVWLSSFWVGIIGGALEMRPDGGSEHAVAFGVGVTGYHGLLASGAHLGTDPPDELVAGLRGDYRQGFTRGYRHRLTSRKRKETLVGVIVAAVAYLTVYCIPYQ